MNPVSSNGGADESLNLPPDMQQQSSGYQNPPVYQDPSSYQNPEQFPTAAPTQVAVDNPPESGGYLSPDQPATTGLPALPVNNAGPGSIDRIREILFGANMRDYEQRFAYLEEAMKKESADVREYTRRQLVALETFVHKELGALEVRMNREREERSESVSRMANDLSVTSTSILRKIGEMESQEAQDKREIRNDVLQQSKELNDAIQTKGEELIALLERHARDLQYSKTDRAALAGLFSEVASRLSDQSKGTGAGG
jgi:hypothetical protein